MTKPSNYCVGDRVVIDWSKCDKYGLKCDNVVRLKWLTITDIEDGEYKFDNPDLKNAIDGCFYYPESIIQRHYFEFGEGVLAYQHFEDEPFEARFVGYGSWYDNPFLVDTDGCYGEVKHVAPIRKEPEPEVILKTECAKCGKDIDVTSVTCGDCSKSEEDLKLAREECLSTIQQFRECTKNAKKFFDDLGIEVADAIRNL